MIDHADPEKQVLLKEKKVLLDVYWLKDMIGDSTYLRSLFIMGYSAADANTELNHLRMEKRQ